MHCTHTNNLKEGPQAKEKVKEKKRRAPIDPRKDRDRERKEPPPRRSKRIEGKDSIKELDKVLERSGRNVLEMLPDGNCFYRCVAEKKLGGQGNYMKCRVTIANHLERHADEYIPFLASGNPRKYLDDRCKALRDPYNTTVWGQECDLVAAARHYNVNIRVIRLNEKSILFSVDGNHTPDVFSGKLLEVSLNGQHYNYVTGAGIRQGWLSRFKDQSKILYRQHMVRTRRQEVDLTDTPEPPARVDVFSEVRLDRVSLFVSHRLQS